MFRRVFAGVCGALVAGTVVTACTTAGTPVAQRATPAHSPRPAHPSTSAAPSRTPVSDEDQVRETLAAFQDAYNTQNWDAYLQLMCSSMREKFTGPVLDMVKKGRADQGLSRATVTAVEIQGDNATATVEGQNELLGSKTVHLPLVRDDGWKVCVPESGVVN
ncbi:MAG TPA: nuclear transport factor 2 family protein [Mycobacterium sp.]|uniref:Rv0361 family membrane protein n=1 Tax=Mycobacterium sp. TaxID=1785 RepID=UPI002D64C797|nr:nuclear transport factor 2 family protein [Mycobacterium sp.]HZU46852.1 nuclear transport factor 2 family protein [Mycobacterium sp.]